MEIIANAKLYYVSDEAISSGWERLDLIVRFKEDKKFFKTELVKTLASTFNVINSHLVPDEKDRYESFDEYYADVEFFINDIPTIEMVAENMIKDYFQKKSDKDFDDTRKANIKNRVSKLPSLEVKVKIN